MKRNAKFDVPEEVLTDFLREVSERDFEAKTGKPNRSGEYPVTVEYEREQEEEVSELEEVLDELISDLDEEEQEEGEN
jgi:hypothetical protein